MSGWRAHLARLVGESGLPAPNGAIGAIGGALDGAAEPAGDDPHDLAEREAMAAHYAAPADPDAYRPGDPDPLRDGLLNGWRTLSGTGARAAARMPTTAAMGYET